MSRRARRDHTPAFKAKVALAAVRAVARYGQPPMVTASPISRLSQAVDEIEKQLKQNRPLEGRRGPLVVGKRIRMQRKIATSRPTPKIRTRMSGF